MMSDSCLAGRILEVDLSRRQIATKRTAEFAGRFLGGRGLNQRLLLNDEKEGSPFDPETILLFGAGRLVGTGAPSAARMSIDSKNVFTGGIGSSNIGGRFARELKFSGFDQIVISGKADTPVYLWIHDGEVEIRDAGHLWGRRIFEAARMLRSSLHDDGIQFIAVGPAGENSVWTSAIVESTGRAAGRCGLGAIMGDKKLKAIVARGKQKSAIRPARPREFASLVREFTGRLASRPAVKRKRQFGTVAAIPSLHSAGAIPVKNFADECVPPAEITHYLPERFHEISLGTINSCTPCVIKCHHGYRSSFAGELPFDKLEANTVWDFGPRLGLTAPGDLLACHALCTHYGLDIDGTASAICWAIDSFDRGLLNSSDTDGLVLRWGDAQTVFELIRKIALNEGLGALLSQGSYRASLQIGRGSERLSIHIKGQDLIEPIRSCKGWALGVVVSPRGRTHTRGAPQTEFYRVDRDLSMKVWGTPSAGIPGVYEGKAKLVAYYERLHAILDSLGLCYFASNWSSPAPGQLGPAEIASLCSAALGADISAEDFMREGERILTLEKIFNLIHTDFTRKDDYPPELLMEEPIKTGPFQGERLERSQWDRMLDEYYSLHGWDPQTSYPRRETLEALDLADYIGALRAKGKIPYPG